MSLSLKVADFFFGGGGLSVFTTGTLNLPLLYLQYFSLDRTIGLTDGET